MASYAPIYREERVMQNVLLAAIVPVTIGTCVNMLSAAWLAPLTHHHTTQQNIWKIFKQLSWFSLAAVCIGAADTYFAIHEAIGGGYRRLYRRALCQQRDAASCSDGSGHINSRLFHRGGDSYWRRCAGLSPHPWRCGIYTCQYCVLRRLEPLLQAVERRRPVRRAVSRKQEVCGQTKPVHYWCTGFLRIV